MPRPMPEAVPGPIRDIIAARWGVQGMKGLAYESGLEYTTVVSTFKRTCNRSLFKFQALCRALGRNMDDAAKVLRLNEAERRAQLLAWIRERYGSVQAMYRDTGITDTYAENLFRGHSGSKITNYYMPLARALGLNLEGLAIALSDTKGREGYRVRGD